MDRATQILQAIARLRPGTTTCPGKLARDLGTTLRDLRPELEALAASGRVSTWQRGQQVAWTRLHGPFRVGPGINPDPDGSSAVGPKLLNPGENRVTVRTTRRDAGGRHGAPRPAR